MRLFRDPFLSRLLMTLAIYTALVGLWMHSPGPVGQRPHRASGGPHAHR